VPRCVFSPTELCTIHVSWVLCNKQSIATNEVLGGMHSNIGMPGVILSGNVVATCGFISRNKVDKQVQRKNFKVSKSKKKIQGNKGTAKKLCNNEGRLYLHTY